AAAITARLQQRLILERRARRPSIREVFAGTRRTVGDDQRLITIVVSLTGTELIARVEQRKKRIVRTVTTSADRQRELFVDPVGTDDVRLRFRLRVPRSRAVTRFTRDAGIGQLRRPLMRRAVVAHVDAGGVT